MLKNENSLSLAIILKTKIAHKNYKIWINVDVIIYNLRNCAEPPMNLSKSIFFNYLPKLKEEYL